MNIAFAHSGEVHDNVVPQISLLWDWGFDPVVLPLLLAAVLYVRGLRAYRAQGGLRFPAWRPWFFHGGVMVVGLALLSPIDLLADFSFTWHMVQHQLLTMVGPPMILLGAPFIPVVRGIPFGVRKAVFVPLARNVVVRAIFIQGTRPLVGLAVMQGSIFFWHFPGWYDRALANELLHYVEHFTFVAGAGLFWWNIVTPYPFPSRVNHLVRVLLLFLSSVLNTVISSMISFSDALLYDYGRIDNFWNLSMLEEQNMGASLMWVVGAMMYMVAIVAVFLVYARQENRKEPKRELYLKNSRPRQR